MLVLTPRPYPQESLFGYLVRLSESNGYHSPTVVTSYAGYSRNGFLGLKTDLHGISDVTGVELSKLNSIGYVTKHGRKRVYSLLGTQISHGLANQHLRPRLRGFCPKCIQDIGYAEAFWDLKLAVACPIHGIEALRRCPACGDEVGWRRPGLLTCRCGASLISSTQKEILSSTRHLLALIHTHLHGTKIPEIDKDYFPKQIKSLTLQELLYLVRILGKYGVLPDRQKKSTVDRRLEVAAEALSDWPYGLHRYFSVLGNYFQSENGTHVGLRKQFSPIYNSIFKSKRFGKTFEFLRKEFVSFGSESWGSAVVDKKLYRNTGKQEIQRFVSVSKAAHRLKVSPRTLKDWCAAGYIPCETVLVKQGKRYVVDSQYIVKFERKPGQTMDARKAAAFLRIPVSVLRKLKSSSYYSSDHLPQIMRGYHQEDLRAFKERLEKASSSVTLKPSQSDRQLTLDSVLKSSKWWATDAKVNLLSSFIDGQIVPAGKMTDEPLSVYFEEKQVSEFMDKVNRSEVSETLTRSQSAEILSCSSKCISEMLKRKILVARHGAGCRIVCAKSLEQFNRRYLALNSIAESQSTSPHLLAQLADELQLDTIGVVVPPRCFTTTFITRSSSETLLKALTRKQEKRRTNKHIKIAEDRDIRALKHYLKNLTRAHQTLPMCGNKLNKAAIAQASGIDRNAIYRNAEIQKLLDAHINRDVTLHDIKTGSQLEILGEYLRSLTDRDKVPPLILNGKPNKRRIAQEASIRRNVFYENAKDANKLLEEYLCV